MCYICEEKSENKYLKDAKYQKIRDHCHYTGEYWSPTHSKSNLKNRVPKNKSCIFHNGSNDDYHSVVKELAGEFEINLLAIYYLLNYLN